METFETKSRSSGLLLSYNSDPEALPPCVLSHPNPWTTKKSKLQKRPRALKLSREQAEALAKNEGPGSQDYFLWTSMSREHALKQCSC